MKIGMKFNRLTDREYLYILDRHQKYTDFNPLALYRSIIENDKLNLEQKIAIRDLAHTLFIKSFEFLQIKDPGTYFDVSTLGLELTEAEKNKFFEDIKKNQEKILKSKRIKHRNFGTYAKHDCGILECPYNGMMVRQNCSHHCMESSSPICFDTDNRPRWRLFDPDCYKFTRAAERRAIDKRAFRDKRGDFYDLLIAETIDLSDELGIS